MDIRVTEGSDGRPVIRIGAAGSVTVTGATMGQVQDAVAAGAVTTLADAKEYADQAAATVVAGEAQARMTAVGDALAEAKTYADLAVASIPAPDLSGYATTTAVEDEAAARAAADEALRTALEAEVEAGDATVLGQALESDKATLTEAKTYADLAVAEVPAPDLSGFATKAALDAEATARETADSASMVVVKHGTDGTVARPTGASAVYWLGTAEPANAVDGDIWREEA